MSRYSAPALEKGLAILELLAAARTPVTVQAIAEMLGRTTSEIYRVLMVLRDSGYVQSRPANGGYELSLKLFELSHQHPPTRRLVQAAMPRMEEMCHAIGQSCHLSLYRHGYLLVVAQVDTPEKMGFGLRLGARLDLCGSGSGTVLLAYHGQEDRTRMLAAAEATPAQVAAVEKEFPRIRTQGYHVAPAPQVHGITNISYPIFALGGVVAAVITIPYLALIPEAVRQPVPTIEQCRRRLAVVADDLSAMLGGGSPALPFKN